MTHRSAKFVGHIISGTSDIIVLACKLDFPDDVIKEWSVFVGRYSSSFYSA